MLVHHRINVKERFLRVAQASGLSFWARRPKLL
jgi:hypothetical protein